MVDDGNRAGPLGERGPSPRAWGIALGLWIVTFTVLALLVVPLLFGRCGAS